MSQLAFVVSRLELQVSGKLLLQTIVKPKQNVRAIMLRSGKELQEYQKEVSKHDLEKQVEEETMKSPTQSLPRKEPRVEPPVVVTPPPPFFGRYAKPGKRSKSKKFFTFFAKLR